MKLRIFFLALIGLLSYQASNGQEVSAKAQLPDSTEKAIENLASKAAFQKKLDSLKVNTWSDTLRSKVTQRFSPKRINSTLDSLRSRGVPPRQLQHVSDSLLKRKESLMGEVSEKQAKLQENVSTRYTGWTNDLRKKFNTDSAGLNVPTLPGAGGVPNVSVPEGKVPDLVGNVPGVPGAAIPGLPGLSMNDFAALDLSPDLKEVGGAYAIPSADQLKNLDGALSEQIGQYTAPLNELKAGMKDPGKVAEQRATELADVQAIEQQSDAFKNNEVLQGAEQLKNTDSPEAILPAAIDHFAGKEVVLKEAMDVMSKYKVKYSSVPSVGEVKKTWWPHNGLKGVPFRERFRVGMNLGVKNATDTLFLDFHPNASYRISGRFEAGLGLMYRLRVQTKNFGFDQSNPVWGTTMFVVAKTFKSVFIRLETDGTSFPKTTGGEGAYRDWHWSFLSGVQTNFRVAKQWMGNVQMLYNFDSQLKDGFPERLVVRLGVQYKLRAKKTTQD